MDRQQYIVRPMVMDETTTNCSGSENPVVAGSSGVMSEAALAHAPTLTEQTLRERGIPLHQAIQQVRMIFFLFSFEASYNHILFKDRDETRRIVFK